MAKESPVIVCAAAVMSIDGKLTRGNEENIYSWVSKEDGWHFHSLVRSHEVVIMGSSTYRAVRNSLRLNSQTLRIVLTSRVDSYQDEAVPTKLEFSDEQPKTLLKRLEKQGIKKSLVVGGKYVFTEFLKNHLIDEFFITTEPYIFGEGISLAEDLPITKMKPIEHSQLNEQGTFLLRYKVQK